MIILPMQPSPLGWRVYPGEQMHTYVPIRFLQVMPLLAQSSIPSSHSFWSGGKNGILSVRGHTTCKEISVYACMYSRYTSDVTQAIIYTADLQSLIKPPNPTLISIVLTGMYWESRWSVWSFNVNSDAIDTDQFLLSQRFPPNTTVAMVPKLSDSAEV